MHTQAGALVKPLCNTSRIAAQACVTPCSAQSRRGIGWLLVRSAPGSESGIWTGYSSQGIWRARLTRSWRKGSAWRCSRPGSSARFWLNSAMPCWRGSLPPPAGFTASAGGGRLPAASARQLCLRRSPCIRRQIWARVLWHCFHNCLHLAHASAERPCSLPDRYDTLRPLPSDVPKIPSQASAPSNLLRLPVRPRTQPSTVHAMADSFSAALIAQLPGLRRYAIALAGNASAADDLVQDCIERA